MNAELLLREFDRLSEAPDAVPRLRTFIRELAIGGRVDGREAGGQVVSVRDVADCRLGKMLDKAKNRGSLRRYLRNVNVRWNDFDLSDVKEMRFEDTEIDEFALRVGDVLVCEGGEPGRAAVWDRREEGILFQKAIHRVRLAESVDPHYFVLSLRQAADSGRLEEYFTGATFKHLTGMGLARFSFPLRPLAEQQRIVAEVDELMAVCDRLEAAQDEKERRRQRLSVAAFARLTAPTETPGMVAERDATFFLSLSSRMVTKPAHVAGVRSAILDLAVQGRLVRQLPVEDPVDDSLRTMSNSADSSGYEALPTSWVPSRMSLVTTLITSGSRGWAQYYAKTGAIFVRSQNVKLGALDIRDLARVSLPKAAEGKRTKLERGDLLIVITGDVGHVAAWETDRGEAYISQHIALARPARTEFTPWVLLCLRAPRAGNRQLRAGIYGGKPGLNLQQVGGISLPLPPLPEQRRIVAKVDELMAICDELEQSLDTLEAGRARALEAVLHRVLEEASAPLPALLEVAG